MTNQKRFLFNATDLPSELIQPYIKFGYVYNANNFQRLYLLFFCLHNETINIFTHLISSIFWIIWLFHVYYDLDIPIYHKFWCYICISSQLIAFLSSNKNLQQKWNRFFFKRGREAGRFFIFILFNFWDLSWWPKNSCRHGHLESFI